MTCVLGRGACVRLSAPSRPSCDLCAGQGSVCPSVCALPAQLFQDLQKKRKLEGEAESSRTKSGSRSQALGASLMAQR